MVPRKRSRRAIGKATTDAVIDGLRLYGPHAVGFFFFAFIAVASAAVIHLMLGVPLVIGIPGVAFSVALSAIVQIAHSHSQHQNRSQR